MPKYKFTCTCGKFEALSEERRKVIEAAREHSKTCRDLQGADDIALDAMTEIVE